GCSVVTGSLRTSFSLMTSTLPGQTGPTLDLSWKLPVNRQPHPEGRPLPRPAVHLHPATVRAHQRGDDRQPQPGAAAAAGPPGPRRVRPVEPFEHMLDLVGLQPRAAA